MAGLRARGLLAQVLPFLIVLLAAVTPTLNGEDACTGHAEEFGACPNLFPCAPCKPVDCEFGVWGQWYEEYKCTGVCFRKRVVSKRHNECGNPCFGTSIMSKACLRTGCQNSVEDCRFSEWDTWSACTTGTDQRVRKRLILTVATPSGQPCKGNMKETAECGGPSGPMDCTYTLWAPWTACSATCGIGHSKRSRVVQTRAIAGGQLCTGNLSQVQACNTQACGGIQDCALSVWSLWSGCDGISPSQRFRHRGVSSGSIGGGKGCKGIMKETQGCPLSMMAPVNCTMSAWSPWKACSKTCGGGQTFRHRQLKIPPNMGGSCNASSIDQMQGCNPQTCRPAGAVIGTPCLFNQWGFWSTCNQDCGQGTRSRARTVAQEATGNGDSCNGAVSEVVSCLGPKPDCLPVDCVWATWEMWGACTKSCGSGFKQRNRFVAIAPVQGGRLCEPWETSQVEACSQTACSPCIDGTWAAWAPWSDCSSSCGNGTRTRHREMGQPPTSCGRPPAGTKDTFEVCVNAPCVADADCKLSDWGAWSACCPDCFGVRKRTRQIEQFATGWGRPCDQAVWQTEPCNPGPNGSMPEFCRFKAPPSDCHLSPWSPWAQCTSTCGGGQSGRERSITSWPDSGGKSCMKVTLGETRECGTAPCTATGCVDCLWGPWSDWGHCFKCGDQRERKRMIDTLPNHCGSRCDARSAAQTSNCFSECNGKRLFCAWTEWTSYSGCPQHGCGPHVTRRHRALQWNKRDTLTGSSNSSEFLFKGSRDAFCVGAESDFQECPYRSCTKPCVPEPCEFGQWTEWGNPLCEGLCERTRLVVKNAICGARPCEGSLIDTKPCESSCSKKVDCELGQWSLWSQCQMKNGQKYRTREIVKPTQHGGMICRGPLKETMPCWLSGMRNACEVGVWGEWSGCATTCGEASKTRKRHILTPATSGGLGCVDALEEIASCGLPACGFNQVTASNCILNTWTPWFCGSEGMESRERDVQVPAVNGGESCDGALHEVRPCPPVDCKVSTWTPWSACDKTCAGGTQTRQRQFDLLPKYGGKACVETLNMHEIQACNQAPCHPNLDCAVELWTAWLPCSVTCGDGQQSRERKVLHPRKANGFPCSLPLTQTQACTEPGCSSVDCAWGIWSVWSACSLSCGGGEQTRDRSIAVAPQKGGKPCEPIPKEELRPCSLHRCAVGGCVDGVWADWSVWGACSSSCNGGVSWRSRGVTTAANWCGNPAIGPDREFRSCNQTVSCGDVDCKLGRWGHWSACNKVCDGLKRRTRVIEQAARGQGAQCTGSLKETSPCNPGVNETTPAGCAAGTIQQHVTCSFSDWSVGGCSATCGGGRLQKSRTTRVGTTQASGVPSSCDGATSVVEPCNKQICPSDVVTPCKWGDWTKWGECDKCGGQRKRHRQISQMPANGASCPVEASEELGKCTRDCHGFAPGSYCTWEPWAQWSTCDATCGKGQRSRRRDLTMEPGGVLPDSIAMLMGNARLYEDVQIVSTKRKAEEIEMSRKQELGLAFVGGWVCLGILFFALRGFRRHPPIDVSALE